jgi:LysR family transcriptional regulator, low CO2-responsive transcriptional regulator
MIDLGALHVFYWVSRTGGVRAASRELFVTQPAVSQRLKLLERRLGLKLYGRVGNKLVLTEDGRKLFEGCRPAFEMLLSMESLMKGKGSELSGFIRIAALSEFSKAFLLPAIEKFRARHPGVKFHIEYRHAYEMHSFLARHEIDLAFTNELHAGPQIESVPGFEERIVCVGPGPSRKLSWREIGKLPWLACGSEDNVWFEFERQAAERGVELSQPAVQVAEMESILTLAAQGYGYTLAPMHALKLRSVPRLAIHRLPERDFKRIIYFCRLKRMPMGRAAQAFWDFLLDRRTIKEPPLP